MFRHSTSLCALLLFLLPLRSGIAPLVLDGRTTSAVHAEVARGRYLADAIAICFECHSERDYTRPGWPIPPGKVGGGRIMYGEGTPDQLIAPNITPDKETGIGEWTDEQIISAIRDGFGRNGQLLDPEMPYKYFRSLSDSDLHAIVAYLRSIPKVRHVLPRNRKFDDTPPRRSVLMDSLVLSNRAPSVLRGQFIVRIAGCETCHTPSRNGQFIEGMAFGGGVMFSHGSESAASSNITPDVTGISYYDENRFVEVMRTGRVGARRLMSAMPWLFYRDMSDQDLRNAYEYLRAIPPVSHRIDNTEPPTICRLCGNKHGFGSRN